MLRALVATVTAGALVGGCGASWPERAAAVTNPAFRQTPAKVTTIDLLPVDLQVWTEPGYDASPEQLRSDAQADITNTTIDGLAHRSYVVGSLIDRDGGGDGGALMARADIDATLASLARYGETATTHRGNLPYPFLPARLGVTSGSDATLYVGGWGYIANHHESTAEKVAEGIAIGLVVISVVALVAVAAGALEHGSHHHSESSSSSRDHRSSAIRDHRSVASEVAQDVGDSAAHVAVNVAADTAVRLVDAFGREAVVDPSHPDWEAAPSAPHGGDPQLYLEMTLVDNATGYVLWHAHQTFPANAASHDDLARAIGTMLGSLPAHGS